MKSQLAATLKTAIACIFLLMPSAERLAAQEAHYEFGRRAGNYIPEIEATLRDLGIHAEQVRTLEVVAKMAEGVPNLWIYGWIGWMQPVTGKGYLVVEVSRNCKAVNIYSRGGYQLEGVTQF